MYKIINNDTVLATVATPIWVKKQANGCFALCDEASAHGVVVDGTVYHVAGKPEIEGTETIILGEVDEATYQKEQAAENDVLGQAVAGLSLQNMQLNTALDTLGTSLAQAQLDIMTLKGGAS